MARFCEKCGSRLDRDTGQCFFCNEKGMKGDFARSKIGKKRKSKRILILLSMFFIIGIVFFFLINKASFIITINEKLLQSVSEKNIVVTEKSVQMDSENEGTATLVIEIPDYESLLKKAVKKRNPEQYMIKTLLFKNFEVQTHEVNAKVTIENGKRKIHSEEAVRNLLEQVIIEAIGGLAIEM